MVARQRQCAPARIPDRRRKRTTQERPNIVTKFFPPSKEQARVWPRHGVPTRNANPRDEFITIVEPHIGRNERAARASLRLLVKAVFRRHPHQCVDEANVLADGDVGPIRTVLPECVCNSFEFLPLYGLTVETN